MPTKSKVNPFLIIAPEIWLEILQIATFIPGEWDVVGTRIDMGVFCSSFQEEAWHSVLPLRRSIVKVCRLWHKIGTKLLYASFHEYCNSEESIHRLAAFAHVLLARPYLGRLVKRLSLRWCPTITDNELIIRHCPNAIIFTSFCGAPVAQWVRSLPECLRGLDASFSGMEMVEVMRILFTLPNLESLHLWGLEGEESPLQYPRLRFPALRLLTLFFPNPRAMKSWTPILTNLDAPALTALSTNIGALSSAVSLFPRDIWGRITYLGVFFKGYRYVKSTYLVNLHHLRLPIVIDEYQTLPKLQKHFPFHQLEMLTLRVSCRYSVDMSEWEPFIRKVLAFPLDTQMMPSLRVLELDWWDQSFEAFVKRHASHRDVVNKFLTSLGSIAVRFEKRGVRLLEVNGGAVQHTPVPIQETVAACRKYVLKAKGED